MELYKVKKANESYAYKIKHDMKNSKNYMLCEFLIL